jgi:hypothetical protein
VDLLSSPQQIHNILTCRDVAVLSKSCGFVEKSSKSCGFVVDLSKSCGFVVDLSRSCGFVEIEQIEQAEFELLPVQMQMTANQVSFVTLVTVYRSSLALNCTVDV